jgi:NhaA family Na+:H+ antiporter
MEQKNKQGVQEFVRPIVKFIRTEINAGIVLLVATIAALIVANSSYSDVYFNFFESTYIDFKFEFWELSKPLYCWINDGLMGIFFFVIGLEVKREIKIGELSTKEKALLPGVAAIGGMLFPALFYVFLIIQIVHISMGGQYLWQQILHLHWVFYHYWVKEFP